MSTMIHMQIQTGMGRHIEYSEEHPGMLEESMKVVMQFFLLSKYF